MSIAHAPCPRLAYLEVPTVTTSFLLARLDTDEIPTPAFDHGAYQLSCSLIKGELLHAWHEPEHPATVCLLGSNHLRTSC